MTEAKVTAWQRLGWNMRYRKRWLKWIIVFLLVVNVAVLPISILSIAGRIAMPRDQGAINLAIALFMITLATTLLICIHAARDQPQPPPLPRRGA